MKRIQQLAKEIGDKILSNEECQNLIIHVLEEKRIEK